MLSSDNVLPQIGSELRRKGLLAIGFSLAGILAYIWFRFELRFGIGALAALAHDVAVCLGLFAFAGYEFNLTTVAAFLTVIGYSVNDSVVVFDRVRENLRRSRRENLVDVLNRSLNQTLSRTALTSGTTLLAVGSLFILGGDVIRGFSFLLLIGVVVGHVLVDLRREPDRADLGEFVRPRAASEEGERGVREKRWPRRTDPRIRCRCGSPGPWGSARSSVALEENERVCDEAWLRRAYDYAERSHRGQVRRSGDPYISHPLGVAHMLAEFNFDQTSVAVGLLHDVLEDTGATKKALAAEFGDEIADLVTACRRSAATSTCAATRCRLRASAS